MNYITNHYKLYYSVYPCLKVKSTKKIEISEVVRLSLSLEEQY